MKYVESILLLFPFVLMAFAIPQIAEEEHERWTPAPKGQEFHLKFVGPVYIPIWKRYPSYNDARPGDLYLSTEIDNGLGCLVEIATK